VVEQSPPSQTLRSPSQTGGPDAPGATYPLVTVAMVAHNPGAWFDEVLNSIRGQDYPSLEIIVVDAASDIAVAPRVHHVIPEATIVPLIANQGFAKNANTILEHADLGPYLLVCHDDVALAPDCIRRLIEETLRSNAGVVGPKLLDWDDPNRILHVGLGADKTGLVSDLAEPGEYDQEQHDAVRDVFAVPGAVTLLRTDLFRALGGFDEAITAHGEDLDLCWRAHVLGARVIVNPAATARHREDLSTRIVGHDRDRISRRHRIRAMLSNYGPLHTLRVVPQALAASLINAVIALFQGRISIIADIFAAWWWNLRQLPSISARRRKLSQIRQVGDAEVRAMQIPGFEGLQAWRRRRADLRADTESFVDDAEAELAAAEKRRWFQVSVLVWTGIIAVLAFGSRGLITGGLPIFNEFAEFPDAPSSFIAEWGSTWRSTGVGGEAPSSLLHALLGFASIALFGQVALLRLLVTVGMLAVGAVGAYRLLIAFKSVPAQLVALLVYVAAPLPYNALHGGSWSGLVAYASMPWIARWMATAAGIPPYGDEGTTTRRRVADTAMVALVTAAAALVEPLIAASIAFLAAGWVVGGLATRRIAGLGRLLAVTLGATVMVFVLLMPASLGVLSGTAQWSILGGTAATSTSGVQLSELLRLATGPHGASTVGWALLVFPALSLVLAFGQRLAWATRSWVVFVSSVGLAWWSTQGDVGVGLADRHVLLAPAAVSLSMAAGMAAMAFRRDLRRYRFGWRQAVPFVAGLAVVLSAGAGLGGALDGRWQVADDGYGGVFEFFEDKTTHARTLWLGDAEVLPVEGWRYDEDLTFSITHARTPTVLDIVPGNADDITLRIRDEFADEIAGGSSRLGARMAVYGIRYVVVVEANAPAPFSTIERPVDAAILDRLTEQLDLVRREVRPGASIYENLAYVPTVTAFAPGALISEPAGSIPDEFSLALREATLRTYRGRAEISEIYVASPVTGNWSMNVDGSPVVRQRIFDWAQLFTVDRAGTAELVHSNDRLLWFAGIGQLVGWIATITVLVLGRRRRT